MLHVHDINTNLILVVKVTGQYRRVRFQRDGAEVYKKREEVWMNAARKGQLNHTNMRFIEEMVIVMKNKDKLNIECECCIEAKIME